jgi:hypothetical protein
MADRLMINVPGVANLRILGGVVREGLAKQVE